MEKVIYCVLSCAAMLAETPHTVLFHSQQKQAVAIDNSTLLRLHARAPAIPLIYFSRETYQEAVRDLPAAEVQAVLEKRLQDWSPQALDQALNWIYERKRKILTLTAQGVAGSPERVSAGLRSYFRETVNLLSRLVGEGRYEAVSFTDLLVFLLEKEALLMAELQAADEQQPAFAAEIQERMQTAQFLSRLLANRGRPEYAQAPLYTELWRVFYITPADDRLRAQLKIEYEPLVPWRDGLVARWRVRRIPELERAGRSVELLYYNSGEFLEDLRDLTPAQLSRNFTARARNSTRNRDRAQYLNGLRLELLLLWQTVHSQSANEQPPTPERLGKVIDIEIARLSSALAQDGSWLTEKAESKGSVIAGLLHEEADLIQDLELFIGLAQQSGRQDLAKPLLGALTFTRSQTAQLKSLTEAQR